MCPWYRKWNKLLGNWFLRDPQRENAYLNTFMHRCQSFRDPFKEKLILQVGIDYLNQTTTWRDYINLYVWRLYWFGSHLAKGECIKRCQGQTLTRSALQQDHMLMPCQSGREQRETQKDEVQITGGGSEIDDNKAHWTGNGGNRMISSLWSITLVFHTIIAIISILECEWCVCPKNKRTTERHSNSLVHCTSNKDAYVAIKETYQRTATVCNHSPQPWL